MGADGFRNLFGHLHLRIVAFLDVFQGNLNVSATTGYAGGDEGGIRYDGVYQRVDFFS